MKGNTNFQQANLFPSSGDMVGSHIRTSAVPGTARYSQSPDTNPSPLLAQVKQPIMLVAGEDYCYQYSELLDNQREILGENMIGRSMTTS